MIFNNKFCMQVNSKKPLQIKLVILVPLYCLAFSILPQNTYSLTVV